MLYVGAFCIQMYALSMDIFKKKYWERLFDKCRVRSLFCTIPGRVHNRIEGWLLRQSSFCRVVKKWIRIIHICGNKNKYVNRVMKSSRGEDACLVFRGYQRQSSCCNRIQEQRHFSRGFSSEYIAHNWGEVYRVLIVWGQLFSIRIHSDIKLSKEKTWKENPTRPPFWFT